MDTKDHISLTTVPQPIELRRSAAGTLCAQQGTKTWVVQAKRCFPWSRADKHISLRDPNGEEIALLCDLSLLDPESKAALEQTLGEMDFVFDVEQIIRVEEEIEIRVWTVKTAQGIRSFQTARDAWPRCLHPGEHLIRDVAGDLYRISAATQVDRASRQYLFAFVE
ncbi:MAG: DUF1854 domain-containing protein [Myxococcales bacterium]|nr:DUF1854 domain-containing protein [Myxococcales bacterium]